jgi:uncharacterized protein YggE
VIAGGVVGVVTALVLADGVVHLAAASPTPAVSARATVQVSGSGEVSGTPDTLRIQLAVSTNASSATAALARNNADMAELQATLEHAGVAARDLATSDLELSPDYDSSGTITGYRSDDALVATLTNLHDAGTVIDAAAGAVGNDVQIEGLTFSLSNTSGLRQAARAEAMSDAHRAAAALAQASGAELGPVEKITDDEQVSLPPSPSSEIASGTGRAASVPVQAGSEQVNDQVTVVYALGT